MSLEPDEILFIDEQGVLERIDEFTLYCHYLEFEPQFSTKYISPIRDNDDRPSFGIYVSKKRKDVEYMWKDQGNGATGDIFDLVKRLYGLHNRTMALAKIKADFGLSAGSWDIPKQVRYVPKPRVDMRIRVKSREFTPADLAYWARFNWDRRLLNYYCTTAIGMYWTFVEQHAPKFPRTPGYAFRMWDRYKLYFPFEAPDFKFRNDMDERHLEGLIQLKFNSDLLVITKAMKEVGFLRSIGIEAVASRGEHTPIEPQFLELFKSRYKYIVTLMDNDGKHKGPMYQTEHGFPMLQVGPEKNITDYCEVYGPDAAEHLLMQILYEQAGIGTFVRSYLSP